MSLYEDLLGESYSELSENLQRLHREAFETWGFLEVTARPWAILFGLPSQGRKLLQMKVAGSGHLEVWDRAFHPLDAFARRWSKRTQQWKCGDLMCEQAGPAVFTFRVIQSRGFIVFEPVGMRLFGLNIPHWLSLKIWAVEMDSEAFFSPLVSFHHPWFGWLCTYAGRIDYPWKSPSGSS